MIHLAPTPDVARTQIRVGLVIRKPLDVFSACLRSLKGQRLPPNTDLTFHLIFDTVDPAIILLASHLPAAIVECEDPVLGDFSDEGSTHHWQRSSMERVGQFKNRILQRALQDKVDAVWLVDADLICDPGTLKSLWFADNPVVSAVFWTRWHDDPALHSAPQVWLRHPYQLDGRGYPDEPSFRRRLLSKQLTQVWGLGACTLIRRPVLEAGVNFSYIPGVSLEGMMAGEDRHFCLQCESRHIPMVADPWPHVYHIYHPSQRPEIPQREVQVANLQTGKPVWANVRMKLLEPIPTGPNAFGLVPPHVQRVRLGAGQILPDLEAQILQHLDGQPFVAQVNYPVWYEVPWLRGTRRLMDVTVIDWKNGTGIPVVEDELRGEFDLTTLTTEQQEALGVATQEGNQQGRVQGEREAGGQVEADQAGGGDLLCDAKEVG